MPPLAALAPPGFFDQKEMLVSEPDPTLRPEERPEDADRALRPQTLDAFIGQAEARANLAVFHRECPAAR